MSIGPTREGAVITVTAGTALVSGRRVKLNASNQAVYAGAGEDYIGVTLANAPIASGDQTSVKLKGQGGTLCISTAGAIAVGALVYGAANGQISATVAGAPIGIAGVGSSGVAASGANEQIEVFQIDPEANVTVQYSYDQADLTKFYFVADRPYRIVGHTHRIGVASGAGATLTIRKVPSGTAIGSGTAILTAAIALDGTANTNATTTLTSTDADRLLAAGDAIGGVFSGTAGSMNGGGTLYLLPL